MLPVAVRAGAGDPQVTLPDGVETDADALTWELLPWVHRSW
jgi:hypothetical protein